MYVHVERAHLVDLSFRDTAILVKNCEKTKNQVFIVLYAGQGWSINSHRDIFDFAVFSGDIAQNIENEKGPALSIPGLHRFKIFFLRYNFVTSSFLDSATCCFKYCVHKIIHQV